ncbi:STAS domain-containing protein [Rhodococcoides kyotonense]|uniref:Anti-anti-sigma factor n=1 Tax=Rhodococcoides kyotonense TaxID=398843 RepID=A0A239FA06_9NOCA|nr:STAS domain-containing protein [Rhodococcus kyotonensis]SNS53870.1 anti-anti-sigma factor [Rhodococcus kyotonensis]
MSSELDAVIESMRERHSYTVEVELYSDEYVIVRCSGELEVSSRAELSSTLDRFLRPGTAIDVDFSAVTFIYSGAANVVIDAAERADGRLRVLATTRPVRMVFHALGADGLLVDDLQTL